MMPRDDAPRHVAELLVAVVERMGAPDHVVRRARLLCEAHVAEAENAGREVAELVVIDLRDAGPADGLSIRCAPRYLLPVGPEHPRRLPGERPT